MYYDHGTCMNYGAHIMLIVHACMIIEYACTIIKLMFWVAITSCDSGLALA